MQQPTEKESHSHAAPDVPEEKPVTEELKFHVDPEATIRSLEDEILRLHDINADMGKELVILTGQGKAESTYYEENLNAVRREERGINERLRAKYDNLENKYKESIIRSVQQIKKLQSGIKQVEEELKVKIQENEGLSTKNGRLSADLANEKKRLGQETSRIGKLKTELASKTAELEKVEDLNAALQAQLDKAKKEKGEKADNETKAKSLKQRAEELVAENTKLEARLAGSRRRIIDLQDEQEFKSHVAAAAKAEVEVRNKELQDRLSKTLRENKTLQDTLSTITSEKGTAKEESVRAEKDLRSQISGLLSQNAAFQNTIQAANERNDRLAEVLNQSHIDHATKIDAALAEAEREKQNAVAAAKEWASKLQSAYRKNTELQDTLDTVKNEAAVAKKEASANEKELRSSLEEASRYLMKPQSEAPTTKDTDEESEAAKTPAGMKSDTKNKRGIKRGRARKIAGGNTATETQAQTQEPQDENAAHLKEQLADALNQMNSYKVEIARLHDLQVLHSKEKEASPRMRSASDPDVRGTYHVARKNEKIAELEAKIAELEASVQTIRDRDDAGSLTIYPFELRKIQTLKAELQDMTEQRNKVVMSLEKWKKRGSVTKTTFHKDARLGAIKKEVATIGNKVQGANRNMGKITDQLAAIQDKLSALEEQH